MPTYVYRREDGSTFELEQRISAPALTVDPETGQRVQRVITGAGLVFKGSGFYLTDYARTGERAKSSANDSDGGASKPAGEPKPGAESKLSADSKPVADAKPASESTPAPKPAPAAGTSPAPAKAAD